MASTDRLIIIGLDGATWTVLDPMRKRGVMPNLDALLKRSAHGTLRSTIPPVTSAAWTTMMTGCDPVRHGVFDHRYYDAEAGQMKVNHSARVRVPTFWHLLSNTSRSVVSLNVPVTYPPLKVNGIVVSGMDAPHLDAAVSGHPAFAARLRAEVPGYHLKVMWKRPPRDLDEITANGKMTIDVAQARADAAELADRMEPDWSALMVQFQNLDPFQHRVWRYLNVDETGIHDPEMNAVADRVMGGFDTAVGRLCELADKRGASIMVVSDHGFGSCLGRIHVNRVLIDAGLARLPGFGGGLVKKVQRVGEQIKLWSEKRYNPEARSATFDQSVPAQFPFDWKRTLGFAPHQDTAGMIYLNTASRKSGAPLQTTRQVDDARSSIMEALSEAIHPETGIKLFPRVIDVASTYRVDPAREGCPDLIAMPDEAYWVRTKLAPGSGYVELDPSLPGTHRPEGIVSICAPGVVPGRTVKADLRDVTPTILSMFGLPTPVHVEGRAIPAVLGEHARAVQHTRLDPPEVPFSGPHHREQEFDYTPEEQKLIEQRLSDLGYLE